MGSDTDEMESVAAYYRIEESHGALRIKVHKSLALWERLLFSVGLPALLAYVSFNFLGRGSIVLALVAAILLLALVTGMNAQLYATKLEFVTTGNIARRGGRGEHIVCTADVQRLEFRDPAGQRSGVYAVTARKEYCILPFLDYLQAMDVIRTIENKFPGLAEHWRANSASNRGSLLSEGLRGLL
jgi:hypothetical protein